LENGNENGEVINVKQLNEMESNIGKYVNEEIGKLNTNVKKYFNNQLNNAIAEHGYTNSLICVFSLDNNEFNNGDKISKLLDKKIAFLLMMQFRIQKVGNLQLMMTILIICISGKNNV